ncbi:hypothetical protein DFP72DRAFT_429447 [Ephemerocybe angulata]|uniref:Uncharacterized protein n=1 Tax=Ephemerocybe angulata TaxID=980116 RepID=A0A8H6HWW9_9AGAR|nr:hypothetical protein DFP72DRAFT_429447 [Tulosesus angulatus]
MAPPKPTSEELAAMSLAEKVALNAKIMARNAARTTAKALKASNVAIPEGVLVDGITGLSRPESPVDMTVTEAEKPIEEDDIESMTPGTLKKFLRFSMKFLGGKRSHSGSNDDLAAKKAKTKAYEDVEEIDLKVGEAAPLHVPKDYLDIWRCREHVPLSLFTKDAITLVHCKGNSLRTVKAQRPGEDKKSWIINPEDSRFRKESELDYATWSGAADLFCEWTQGLDRDGIVYSWMARHFAYVQTLVTRDGEDWPLVRSFDIATRSEYQMTPFTYGDDTHSARFIKHERAVQKKAAADKATAQAASSSRGGGGGGGSGSRGGASGQGFRSFRERQAGGRPSTSVCLICANTGHRSDACKATLTRTGAALFSKIRSDGKLVSIEGNKLICTPWNVFGKANWACKEHNRSEHMCSLCGKSDHPACSNTCVPKQDA